jgi:hypothetical protein
MKKAAMLLAFLLMLNTASTAVIGAETQSARYTVDDIAVKSIDLSDVQYCKFISEDRIMVTKNGKKGIIDTDGNVIADFLYDTYSGIANGCIIVEIESEDADEFLGSGYFYGLIDIESGDIVLPVEYDNIEVGYNKDMFRVVKDGKIGMVNSKGEVKMPIIYSTLEESYGDYSNIVAVSLNKNFPYNAYPGDTEYSNSYKTVYGYIDISGQALSDFEYEYLSPFSYKGVAIAERKDIYYLGMTSSQFEGTYGTRPIFYEDYYHDAVVIDTNFNTVTTIVTSEDEATDIVDTAYDYQNGLFRMETDPTTLDYDDIYSEYYLYDTGNKKVINLTDLDERLSEVSFFTSSNRDLTRDYYSDNRTDSCALLELGNSDEVVIGLLYYRNGNGYNYIGVKDVPLTYEDEENIEIEYMYNNLICAFDNTTATYGLFTTDGDVIFDFGTYSGIEVVEDDDGLLFLLDDDETYQTTLVDEDGNTLLQGEYIDYEEYSDKLAFYVYDDNGNVALEEKDGTLLLECSSNLNVDNYYSDYGVYSDDDKITIISMPWITDAEVDNIVKTDDYDSVAVYKDNDNARYYVVSVIAPDDLTADEISQVTNSSYVVNTSDTVYKYVEINGTDYSAVDFGGTENDYLFAGIITDIYGNDALSNVLTLKTVVE